MAGQAALDLALVSAHRALKDAIASKQAALVAVGAQEPAPGPAAPASPPCSGASDATLRAQVEVTFLKVLSSVATSDLKAEAPAAHFMDTLRHMYTEITGAAPKLPEVTAPIPVAAAPAPAPTTPGSRRVHAARPEVALGDDHDRLKQRESCKVASMAEPSLARVTKLANAQAETGPLRQRHLADGRRIAELEAELDAEDAGVGA